MKKQGINLRIKFENVARYNPGSIKVERVRTNDGRWFYSIEEAKERIGKSIKTIRRRIEKVDVTNQHNTCFKLGNKWYVNDNLNQVGRSRTLTTLFSGEENIMNPGGEIGIEVDVNQLQQFNGADIVPVTGITMDNGIIYYDVEMFCKKFNISSASIYDYISRIKGEEYRYFLYVGGKYYASPGLLLLTKRYMSHLKNTEYAVWLNHYTWSVAGSVRYPDHLPYSANKCVVVMKKMEKHLKKKYPNSQHTFFYVTEKNPGCDGYHSHFVYSIPDLTLDEEDLITEMKIVLCGNHGNFKRQSLIEKFDQKDYYLEYMVKQMHKMPDHYDWFDHNLMV